MPTHRRHCTDLAVLVEGDDDRFASDVGAEPVTDLADLLGATDADPLVTKDPLDLGGEQFLRGVGVEGK